MLYHWLYQFLDINIFKYITFRAFGAFLTSFFLFLIFAPYVIQKLKKFQNKTGGYIREYTPDSHKSKKYIPTMGGVLITLTVLISSLLWCRLDNFYCWVTLFTFLSFSIIGFMDDYLKIKKKTGLSAKTKFGLQVLFSLVIATALYLYPDFNTYLYFPIFKTLYIDMGVFFILWASFIIVASSNAVNLTDGLDGLAIGPALIVATTFAIIAYITGHIILSNYLHLTYISGVGEITVFLMALLGAGLGFLWFNAFPAQMFMGDVGSLSIGAVLGLTAVITKQEFLFALVGAIFVIETLSVILQVAYFKITGGKRLFKRAPIHHHFELKGIPESKIVIRVWIITIIFAIITLALIKIR